MAIESKSSTSRHADALPAGGRGFSARALTFGRVRGCAELSWEFNATALSDHFHVIGPDWLGFWPVGEDFSFDDMCFAHPSYRRVLRELGSIGRIHRQFDGRRHARARGAMDEPCWPIEKMIWRALALCARHETPSC